MMAHDQLTNLTRAFNTINLTDRSDASWYVDASNTSHPTSNTCKLLSIKNKIRAKSVFVGNGHCIPVSHIGYYKLNSFYKPLHMHNVPVMHNIIKNINFVHRFTTDNLVSF